MKININSITNRNHMIIIGMLSVSLFFVFSTKAYAQMDPYYSFDTYTLSGDKKVGTVKCNYQNRTWVETGVDGKSFVFKPVWGGSGASFFYLWDHSRKILLEVNLTKMIVRYGALNTLPRDPAAVSVIDLYKIKNPKRDYSSRFNTKR